jgi:hypothetical protein
MIQQDWRARAIDWNNINEDGGTAAQKRQGSGSGLQNLVGTTRCLITIYSFNFFPSLLVSFSTDSRF